MEPAQEGEVQHKAGSDDAAATTSSSNGGGAEQQQGSADGGSTAPSSAPLPLPYVLDADGRKQPLPGARSIFIRGGTAEAFGLAGLGSSGPGGQLTAAVPRERLLADVQFQGAISDFHPLKEGIKAADYDPLLVRVNEDATYGDGNNYEVALTQAAAQAWLEADAAAAAAAVAAAVAAAAAAEGAAGGDSGPEGRGPRSKRRRDPRPWQDMGTEAELEAAGIFSIAHQPPSSRPAPGGAPPAALLPNGLLLSRPRRAYGAPLALVDAPPSELWASNTMEARPFKDAAYDLRRATQEAAAQAVPVLQEAGVQATGGRPRNRCCQTAPQSAPQEQLDAVMASPGFACFLDAVRPRLEEALLAASIADIMAEDLDQLGDAEGEGLQGPAAHAAAAAAAGTSSSGGAGGGGARLGGSGGRQERGGLTEAQSFTDLAYSKNKVVSAICWVPNRHGVVAAACTSPASQAQRLTTMGRLAPAHILLWNFRDPIHPECVLESPHEVTTFQFNPVNPAIIVGGCYNGQVVVWDTSASCSSNSSGGSSSAGSKGAGKAGGRGGSAGAWDDGAEHEAVTPVIRHKCLSSVEHSHTATVCDLCWLPGLEVDRSGRVFPVRANSAGTSAQSLLRSMTLGSTAVAAAAAGSNVPREACFFASLAPDGKVMFWDVRLDKLLKKGAKRVDEAEVVWRPMHVVHLLSVAGNDFAGCRFCFDPYRLDSGGFTAGSLEGELLAGNFIRPPGDDNPDYARLVFSPHAGPVVALAPSPFLPQLLLSVGDWTFRLWDGQAGLDGRVPLFVSPYSDEAYTAACWSPSRPGLLFLATAAGSLQVWDLLDRSHEPSLTISTASCAITCLAFSNALPKHHAHGGGQAVTAAGGTADAATAAAAAAGGSAGSNNSSGSGSGAAPSSHQPADTGLQVLALGDASGVLHLFELPRTLRRPLQSERRLMEGFVAREAKRLADVASRTGLRAAALVEAKKREEERDKAATTGDGATVPDQQQQQQQKQQQQQPRQSQRASRVLSSSQAGALAAAPAPVWPSGGLGGGGTGSPLKAAGGGSAGASGGGVEAAELAKAEAAYQQLVAEFREQLGLA